MPYIPRRSAPTTSVPTEIMRPPRSHAPIPIQPADKKPADTTQTPTERRRKIGLGTINLHTYQPDQKQLLKSLFGKEPDVDPHTGQLVLNRPDAAQSPVTFGHGG